MTLARHLNEQLEAIAETAKTEIYNHLGTLPRIKKGEDLFFNTPVIEANENLITGLKMDEETDLYCLTPEDDFFSVEEYQAADLINILHRLQEQEYYFLTDKFSL